MLEAYAFFAAFTLQILAMSVLHPAWFSRYVRAQATRYPADVERFAQFYPGVDFSRAQERFLTQYRVSNTGIVVLGALLLGWLFSYMRRSDWDNGPVVALVAVFSVMQALPLCFVAWVGVRFKSRVLKHSLPEAKRKATLQRRGLFDFVSPFMVLLAVLSYFLFVAFVIYVQQHPSQFAGLPIKSRVGYSLIGAMTLAYAVNALTVYTMLYGKKINPLETRADNLRKIGRVVKSCVYSCIVCVVFVLLILTLKLLDLQRWQPFALSVFFVICALLGLMGMTATPREPEAATRGSSPVP
jgi:hypothetical protein